MGAWSHEPFGNDSANDWAYDLEDGEDFSLLEAAFDAVIETGDEYLDSDFACAAIAAAEVLAKARGRGTQSDAYTKKIDQWLQSISVEPTPELRAKATAALNRVLAENSELSELWAESSESELWRASVLALIAANAP